MTLSLFVKMTLKSPFQRVQKFVFSCLDSYLNFQIKAKDKEKEQKYKEKVKGSKKNNKVRKKEGRREEKEK